MTWCYRLDPTLGTTMVQNGSKVIGSNITLADLTFTCHIYHTWGIVDARTSQETMLWALWMFWLKQIVMKTVSVLSGRWSTVKIFSHIICQMDTIEISPVRISLPDLAGCLKCCPKRQNIIGKSNFGPQPVIATKSRSLPNTVFALPQTIASMEI